MKVAFITTNEKELEQIKLITNEDFKRIKNIKSYKSLIIIEAETEELAQSKYNEIINNF